MESAGRRQEVDEKLTELLVHQLTHQRKCSEDRFWYGRASVGKRRSVELQPEALERARDVNDKLCAFLVAGLVFESPCSRGGRRGRRHPRRGVIAARRTVLGGRLAVRRPAPRRVRDLFWRSSGGPPGTRTSNLRTKSPLGGCRSESRNASDLRVYLSTQPIISLRFPGHDGDETGTKPGASQVGCQFGQQSDASLTRRTRRA